LRNKFFRFDRIDPDLIGLYKRDEVRPMDAAVAAGCFSAFQYPLLGPINNREACNTAKLGYINGGIIFLHKGLQA